MDRGFASWEFLDQMSLTQTKFVVRIKNNMKTELDHDRYVVVGSVIWRVGASFVWQLMSMRATKKSVIPIASLAN
ncbi:hypothetical protein O77CONTIG1_03007 [Leptolyngbya sp. O-77]|nr:hypothetical protein O77CONTIG1_03007 [Leptolyngbya sp. O-77]